MRIAILFVLGLGLLCSGAASAGLYIKFTDIEGESNEKNHKNWSDILSVEWGVSMVAPSPGGGARPVFSDLSWYQELDRSFPPLTSVLYAGDSIDTATVDFTTSFGGGSAATYFQMAFNNVFLTSLQLSGSPDGASFSGSFAYSEIKLTYYQFDGTGKTVGKTESQYNLKKGGSPADLMAVFALGMAGPNAIPVPEPETFAMLLAGLGLLGFAARRRKQKAA